MTRTLAVSATPTAAACLLPFPPLHTPPVTIPPNTYLCTGRGAPAAAPRRQRVPAPAAVPGAAAAAVRGGAAAGILRRGGVAALLRANALERGCGAECKPLRRRNTCLPHKGPTLSFSLIGWRGPATIAGAPAWPSMPSNPPPPFLQRVAAEEGSGFQLRLTRADAEEVAAWEAAQREQRIEAIHAAAGGPAHAGAGGQPVACAALQQHHVWEPTECA